MPPKMPPTPGTAADKVLQAVKSQPQGQRLTSEEIADRTGVEYPSVCAYITLLERAGFVRRIPVSYAAVNKEPTP